jgi:hypothetical protein
MAGRARVCENAIRPFCVGRRAWLFTDTVAGANASENLYSLLQTCIANGIDGYWYLRRLLTRLQGQDRGRLRDPAALELRAGGELTAAAAWQ